MKAVRSGCDFSNCFREMRIPRNEWKSLLSEARSLDLNAGAYYDARLGAINFWCGPDNKPKDWPGSIDRGLLKYPREIVGSVVGDPDSVTSKSIRLHFEACTYQRAEVANLKPASAAYLRKIAGTKADQAWIVNHFDLLRQHVRLMRHS